MTEDFTDDERKQIRELLDHSKEITEWVELRGAKRVVFQAYRQVILGLAGLAGAVILLWDFIKELLRGALT